MHARTAIKGIALSESSCRAELSMDSAAACAITSGATGGWETQVAEGGTCGGAGLLGTRCGVAVVG